MSIEYFIIDAVIDGMWNFSDLVELTAMDLGKVDISGIKILKWELQTPRGKKNYYIQWTIQFFTGNSDPTLENSHTFNNSNLKPTN